VSEDSGAEVLSQDAPDFAEQALYAYLSGLLYEIVEALGASL